MSNIQVSILHFNRSRFERYVDGSYGKALKPPHKLFTCQTWIILLKFISPMNIIHVLYKFDLRSPMFCNMLLLKLIDSDDDWFYLFLCGCNPRFLMKLISRTQCWWDQFSPAAILEVHLLKVLTSVTLFWTFPRSR